MRLADLGRMATISEITDVSQLEHIHLLWQAQLAQTRQASFLQSLPWVRCYWNHFGEQRGFRILVCQSAGRVLGLLPLELRGTQLGSPELRGAAWGDVIGRNVAATLSVVMKEFAGSSRTRITLSLTNDRGRCQNAARLARLRCQQESVAAGPGVDLTVPRPESVGVRAPTIQQPLANGCSFRETCWDQTFQRHRPLGQARGDGECRYAWFDEFQFHWSSRDGKWLWFLRDVYQAAAKAGALDVCRLVRGGTTVASMIAGHWQGHVTPLGFTCVDRCDDDSRFRQRLAAPLHDRRQPGDEYYYLHFLPAGLTADWSTKGRELHRYCAQKTRRARLLQSLGSQLRIQR